MNDGMWMAAVIDALVVAGIYRQEHDSDPRKAIHDLIGWETQVALDPQVCQGAFDLLEAGRQQGLEEAADIAECEATGDARDQEYDRATRMCAHAIRYHAKHND